MTSATHASERERESRSRDLHQQALAELYGTSFDALNSLYREGLADSYAGLAAAIEDKSDARIRRAAARLIELFAAFAPPGYAQAAANLAHEEGAVDLQQARALLASVSILLTHEEPKQSRF